MEIKQWIVKALILHLLNFYKVFKVTCDALGIGIGGVPLKGNHMTYIDEKLNETRYQYSTYDKNFYMVIPLHQL